MNVDGTACKTFILGESLGGCVVARVAQDMGDAIDGAFVGRCLEVLLEVFCREARRFRRFSGFYKKRMIGTFGQLN